MTFGVSRDAREARRVAPRARTHRRLVERRPRGSAAAPARRPAARRWGGGGDARTTPAAAPGRKAGARRARARPRRGRLPVPRELRGEGNHAESRRHLFRYLLIFINNLVSWNRFSILAKKIEIRINSVVVSTHLFPRKGSPPPEDSRSGHASPRQRVAAGGGLRVAARAPRAEGASRIARRSPVCPDPPEHRTRSPGSTQINCC